jgi:hypothetical protein
MNNIEVNNIKGFIKIYKYIKDLGGHCDCVSCLECPIFNIKNQICPGLGKPKSILHHLNKWYNTIGIYYINDINKRKEFIDIIDKIRKPKVDYNNFYYNTEECIQILDQFSKNFIPQA